MATLEIWHAPTKLFLAAADHTYVRCRSCGKAWSCWGGKSGGSLLRSGSGSTARADAIAERSERAGITTYMVDGVSHQAANRIAIGAGITVRGARGSGLSEAIFGVYGRQLWTPYAGRFHTQDHINGESLDCSAASLTPASNTAIAVSTNLDGDEADYVRETLALYRGAPVPPRGLGLKGSATGREFGAWRLAASAHHAQLFDFWARYRLGQLFNEKRLRALKRLREHVEWEQMDIAADDANGAQREQTALDAMNDLILLFQREAKNILSDTEYVVLFDVATFDDEITLIDSDAVAVRSGATTSTRRQA
jgi:hypothetical protein